jgi:hypothetical protein
MATIFAVTDLEFAFPEEMTGDAIGSLGRAKDGSYQWLEFRSADRPIVIHLRLITGSVAASLKTALETATNRAGNITPPSNIDLGNGAGVEVTVQWLDKRFAAIRNTPLYFDVDLNFMYLH